MVIMTMSISEVKICYWPGRFWLELILSKSYLMSWILQVRINQKIIDFNLFVKTWNYSRFSCFCNQILSSIPFAFQILKKSAKKSSLSQEQFCTKKQPDQTLHNCRALLSTNCRIFYDLIDEFCEIFGRTSQLGKWNDYFLPDVFFFSLIYLNCCYYLKSALIYPKQSPTTNDELGGNFVGFLRTRFLKDLWDLAWKVEWYL